MTLVNLMGSTITQESPSATQSKTTFKFRTVKSLLIVIRCLKSLHNKKFKSQKLLISPKANQKKNNNEETKLPKGTDKEKNNTSKNFKTKIAS
jgi:hypothetical protein